MTFRGVTFRAAQAEDVAAIAALLADDPFGRGRESPGDPAYARAFAAVAADPNQLLAVAEEAGAVVGTLQVSFIPGLSLRGAWRGQLEGVRVAASHRGQGVGRAMVQWAIERCRERGCALVQLTSNEARVDARRFYEGLGFGVSHLGFKLAL